MKYNHVCYTRCEFGFELVAKEDLSSVVALEVTVALGVSVILNL